MGALRQPGTVGIVERAADLDDGTLCRTLSPVPAHRGAPAPRLPVHISSTSAEKALHAAWRALPKLPEGLRGEIAALLTLKSMAIMGGALAVHLGSHAIGIGFAIDVLVFGVGILSFGWEAIRAAGEFESFWRTAIHASNEHDLDVAADHFARAVSIVGVNGALILLMKRGGGQAAVSKQAVTEWAAFIDALNLKAGNRGALWSKVGGEVAEALARQDGRMTLEMLLKKTGFQGRYDAAFGKTQNALTAEIWEILSRKFARGLEGVVIAYIDDLELMEHVHNKVKIDFPFKQGEAIKGGPQLTAELDEISKVMVANPKITFVILKDVMSGRTATMSRDAVLRAGQFNH